MSPTSRFLHIGLGKTGTTFAQSEIFPLLSEKLGLNYLCHNTRELEEHKARLFLNYPTQKISLPRNSFVSQEILAGWDPEIWEQYSQKNADSFGRDWHIIITIRKPEEYLTSVYLHRIYNFFKINVPEENFFLPDHLYTNSLPSPVFNIDKFSYFKLISFYKERFNNVSVIKFEDILNLKFLSIIFDISPSELKINQRNYIHNRSYSKKAINLIKKCQSALNCFGWQFEDKFSKHRHEMLNLLRGENPKIQTNSQPLSRIKKELNWRHFIQNRYDRFLIRKYEKYKVDFTKIPYINIKKLNKEYDDITTSTL